MHPHRKKIAATAHWHLAWLAPLALLAACKEPPAATSAAELPASCGGNGHVNGRLYGAIAADIDWNATAVQCESMPRPDGAGVRLRFSGDVADERLSILIAIPDLERGTTGTEFSSNVTVTVEGSGRFFSTANLAVCWTDVTAQTQKHEDKNHYAINGELVCVAPLGELNSNASVSIDSLTFSGIAAWTES